MNRAIPVGILMMNFAVVLASFVVATHPAAAQGFPAKPVELVVPFGAGSAPDTVARELARGMSKHLGAQVIVANRPGAGGAIGYKYTLSKPADGYTIVLSSNSISTGYHGGMMPFDHTAFEPVARVTLELPVLAVQSGSPHRNLKDIVAFARKQPGKLRVGSTSIGSHMHLTLVGFFDGQGSEVTEVPFPKGGHVTSLLGGEIDAVVTLPASLATQVQAGSLRVLGVLASAREPVFPDVPTATEQGFGFQADLWRGINVPRGTAAEVIARLDQAVRETVTGAEFRQLGASVGFLPAYQSSREFARTIVADDAVIAKMMTRAGLKKSQ